MKGATRALHHAVSPLGHSIAFFCHWYIAFQSFSTMLALCYSAVVEIGSKSFIVVSRHCYSWTDLVTNLRNDLDCGSFGKARIGRCAAITYSNMVRRSVFPNYHAREHISLATPITWISFVLSSLISALLWSGSRQQVGLFISLVGAQLTQFAMYAYTCLC